ncbi:MAG: molybdate ABC transporter substrate-binding protein [Cellvibrionaceae bacterium]
MRVAVLFILFISFFATATHASSKVENNTENKTENIHIASAANFRDALQEIITLYKHQNPNTNITLSTGSSGSLYQQSLHGAPFDIFLSADSYYPQQLSNALELKKAPKTYALGELVFWNTQYNAAQPRTVDLKTILQKNQKLAIANPKTAPYGKAALKVLEQFSSKATLVKGNSIGQVFQFIHTGNVQAGFIARSQAHKVSDAQQLISIPQSLYPPLEQQGLLLSHNKAAEHFFHFLWQAKTQAIIRNHGYQTPQIALAAN